MSNNRLRCEPANRERIILNIIVEAECVSTFNYNNCSYNTSKHIKKIVNYGILY